VLKWFKFFVGILLLPVCAGAVTTLGQVLQSTGRADTTWCQCWPGPLLDRHFPDPAQADVALCART